MKNYEVEAVKCFTDKEENKKRNIGDKFNCTEQRYKILKSKGAVKLIEIQTTIDEVIDEAVEEIMPKIERVVDEIVEKVVTPKPKKKKTSKK